MNRPVLFRILAAAMALMGDPVAESAYADEHDHSGIAHISLQASDDAHGKTIGTLIEISAKFSAGPTLAVESDADAEKNIDCDPAPAVADFHYSESVSRGSGWRRGPGHAAFLALVSPHSHTPFPTINTTNENT